IGFWEDRLQRAGAPVPPRRASWRSRLLGAIARRLGPDLVLPTIAAKEQVEQNGYVKQPETAGTPMPGHERWHAKVLHQLVSTQPRGLQGSFLGRLEGRHRSVGGNALRAAVLGANDGLCSNLSLVMGVAGASIDSHRRARPRGARYRPQGSRRLCVGSGRGLVRPVRARRRGADPAVSVLSRDARGGVERGRERAGALRARSRDHGVHGNAGMALRWPPAPAGPRGGRTDLRYRQADRHRDTRVTSPPVSSRRAPASSTARPFKAVIFDAYGTLLRNDDLVLIPRRIVADHGLSARIEEVWRAWSELYFEATQLAPFRTLREIEAQILPRVLRQFDVGADAAPY